MNNKIGLLISFSTGLVIGAVSAWRACKGYYECISNEEIESVKETFEKKYKKMDEKIDKGLEREVSNLKKDVDEYAKRLAKTKYTTYSEQEIKENFDKPYVISPEEFGEFDDYETISLTYYADGTLTDENDEEVDDVDEIVGKESLNHIGDYEEDAVHVRNDRLKCDYEILRDERVYDGHPGRY